jgi:crotonobetainyl-CoA:carnitine CoA-transferase CaiB-like acyl-CoA transferase
LVVLDLGQIYNGTYCGLLMAYLGADVIKVEPTYGDPLRARNDPSRDAYEFVMLNSNKRSVAIDLKVDSGRKAFLQLVAGADVLIENFNCGVMERLGLGYEELQLINPRLIYARGKGYGLSGPNADFPAMDLTIQAMSGVMATTGRPGDPPMKAGPAFCDFLGGIHLLSGVLAALYQRDRIGEGQLVEVSMQDATVPALASAFSGLFDQSRSLPERTGNRHSGLSVVPYNVYTTTDGHVALLCLTERHWQRLVAAMKRPELLDDPRFANNYARTENIDEVDCVIETWTKTETTDTVVEILLAAGVTAAPVLTLAQVADNPHLHERGMLRYVEHPRNGRTLVPGNPIRLSRSPLDEVRAAPVLGADTESVLTTHAGLNEAELMQLRESGAVA